MRNANRQRRGGRGPAAAASLPPGRRIVSVVENAPATGVRLATTAGPHGIVGSPNVRVTGTKAGLGDAAVGVKATVVNATQFTYGAGWTADTSGGSWRLATGE